jgi:hypothetical protein
VAVALQDSQGHDVQHPVMVQHSTQQPHVLTVLQTHMQACVHARMHGKGTGSQLVSMAHAAGLPGVMMNSSRVWFSTALSSPIC